MDILYTFIVFVITFPIIMAILSDGQPIKYSYIVAKNEGFFSFFTALFFSIFVLKSKYIKMSSIAFPTKYIDPKNYGLVEMACRKTLNGNVWAIHPDKDSIKFTDQNTNKDVVLTFTSIHCTFDSVHSFVIPPKLVLLIEAAVKRTLREKVEKKNVFDIN